MSNRRSRPFAERGTDERRRYTPAAYGADFAENLRWRYRTGYGRGSDMSPRRGGGSYGRGYRRASDLGFRGPEPGRYPVGYGAEYYARRLRYGRGRTAARDYDRAYPYFGSTAAMEGAQGYPPGDSLNPDTYPHGFGPARSGYDGEY